MRIAILVQLFPPKWIGGTEIATFNIAENLAKRGHKINVVTSVDSGSVKKEESSGFTIYRILQPRLKFLGVIIFWLKIFFLLKKINPDIIHVQSIVIGIPALIFKKIFNKPYLVYCRGSDVYFPWRRKSLISNSVLKNADKVLALAENMKTKIQDIWGINASVIPNGIDVERFENLSKADVRRKLGLKREEKIIIFVGTLKSVKGVEYLIEAMSIVNKNNAETKLILIGDGEEKENLKKLVQELNLEHCVFFLGRKSNEKIPEHMAASDIFVLPSLSEGFPNVFLEAMASGLPIVATKVGGVPEIIKDGENGFLVEPKNPQQLAEKILFLLENENLKERISQNNREKVKEYSWEEVVKKLESVYNRFIK